MDLVLEQCPLFQPAHITAFRVRISSMLGSGKLSNLHSNSPELLVTLTSITLRRECPWNINSKVPGTRPSVAHKANPPSSLNSYGKTPTNLSHLPLPSFFSGSCSEFESGQPEALSRS
eukprot:TRINITY_DN88528_c0_g1_i1.p1 TRINITY_DN88528_c0_g1~~TRINITY_DN88528_c0_g1_i1.p1  ORF type:complete len:118 (-),score=9.05 TRINITY_DN88528_c0_g1_i1:59-412(-)